MAEFDNRGRFSLFKNEDKREGKKDPDYKGKYTDMDGVEYFADAWINTSKAGTKYMSGKMKRKDKQPDTAYNAAIHGDHGTMSSKEAAAIAATVPADLDDPMDW